MVPRDPVLVDLLRDNVRLALREGLVGEWRLGQAIAELLTGTRQEEP